MRAPGMRRSPGRLAGRHHGPGQRCASRVRRLVAIVAAVLAVLTVLAACGARARRAPSAEAETTSSAENPLASSSLAVPANHSNEGIVDLRIVNSTGQKLTRQKFKGSPAETQCSGSSKPATSAATIESRIGTIADSCTSNRSAFTGTYVEFVYKIGNGPLWLNGAIGVPYDAGGTNRPNYVRCWITNGEKTGEFGSDAWRDGRIAAKDTDRHSELGCDSRFRAANPRTRNPMPQITVVRPTVINAGTAEAAKQATSLLEKTCGFELSGRVAAVKDLPRTGKPGEAYAVEADGRIYAWNSADLGWRDTKEPAPPQNADCQPGDTQTVPHEGQTIVPAFLRGAELIGTTVCNRTQNPAKKTVSWDYTKSVTNEHWAAFTIGGEAGGEAGVPFVAKGQIKIHASATYNYKNVVTTSTTFKDQTETTIPPGYTGGVELQEGTLVAASDWYVANPPDNVPSPGAGGEGTLYYLKDFVMYYPIANNRSAPSQHGPIPSGHLTLVEWPCDTPAELGSPPPRNARVIRELAP